VSQQRGTFSLDLPSSPPPNLQNAFTADDNRKPYLRSAPGV